VAWALIPVKDLTRAKERLAPRLDAAARRDLVVAMLRDVLGTAGACPLIEGVIVVSRDKEVLSIAVDAGAEVLAEPGSLNDALASASRKLRDRGVDRAIVLAADLPFLTSDALALILNDRSDVVVVPSNDGGTNALALAPGSIDLRYGPASAGLHAAAARAAGLSAVVLEIPVLALDIDTPADLDVLLSRIQEAGSHTRAAFPLIAPRSG
jgi:2-phospho-L-lactate guanylyltransferase